MHQPEHDLRAFQSSPASPNRVFALVAVAALHVVVIYGLASGLANQLIKKLPDEFKAEVVKEAPPPEDKAPPPPPPDLAKPPPPFVPPPDINISSEAPATNAISNVQSKVAAPPPPAPPAERPTQPSLLTSSLGKLDDYYPPMARRLNQEGIVTLRVTVNADGTVADAAVESSSGYTSLDEAAVRFAKERMRYHPGTQGGKPVAMTTLTKVKFKLTD